MKKRIYRINFLFCRWLARCFTLRYRVRYACPALNPAVYIVHHQNMRGPVLSMAWLNFSVRLWVLDVFCRRKSCFRQFFNYTFTKRFGLPKALAAVIVFPISLFVPMLMRSIRAIPVSRGSKDVINTFRHSIATLTSGESLLISPDINYSDKDLHIGEMYQGFLDLEKFYKRRTGKPLAFVPMHICSRKRIIYVGEAIYFDTDEDFRSEKAKVYQQIKTEFLRLENLETRLS